MANAKYQEALETEALQRAVIAAMLTLPDEQWLVLFHRFYNGLTLARTAEVLDMSLEQTRILEARALRNLRRMKTSKVLREYT